MSAMRALALPETDAESRAAATWAVPAQAAHTEAAQTHVGPDLAVRSATTRGTPALGTPALGIPVRGQAVRGQAAAAPLRLTRRGRIVVAAAAALLVSLLLLLATGAAQATSHSAPPRVADRNLTRVVVRPGQSLWSVAQAADPNADPRQVMQQIIELNGLTGDVILVGQQLWVPRG
jgi:LysM repeat protein